jgi:DNA-directed RNA polymerase specialized sigma24 family protein
MEPQEEIIRLMVLQLRMQLPSQSEVINELYRAGFGPARIAQLIGTTANTVNVAVQRAKKKTNSKKKG